LQPEITNRPRRHFLGTGSPTEENDYNKGLKAGAMDDRRKGHSCSLLNPGGLESNTRSPSQKRQRKPLPLSRTGETHEGPKRTSYALPIMKGECGKILGRGSLADQSDGGVCCKPATRERFEKGALIVLKRPPIKNIEIRSEWRKDDKLLLPESLCTPSIRKGSTCFREGIWCQRDRRGAAVGKTTVEAQLTTGSAMGVSRQRHWGKRGGKGGVKRLQTPISCSAPSRRP